MTRDRDTFDMFRAPERGRFGDEESSERVEKPSVHQFDVALHAQTHQGNPEKGAVLVSSDANEANAKWIPKSLLLEFSECGEVKGTNRVGQVTLKLVRIKVEEWVAKDKGLI